MILLQLNFSYGIEFENEDIFVTACTILWLMLSQEARDFRKQIDLEILPQRNRNELESNCWSVFNAPWDVCRLPWDPPEDYSLEALDCIFKSHYKILKCPKIAISIWHNNTTAIGQKMPIVDNSSIGFQTENLIFRSSWGIVLGPSPEILEFKKPLLFTITITYYLY